jgi:hypothetical protein
MSRTVVLIPAAGSSLRYAKEGYTEPKQILTIRYNNTIKSMLAHVEESVRDFGVVIGMKTGVRIPGDLRGMVAEIDETKGQADTISQMLQYVPPASPIIVVDCDMILRAEDILTLDRLVCSYDVAVAVTKTFDPNASRINTFPYPTVFAEKEPISEYGIVGARAFRSAELLRVALAKLLSSTMTEPYLSTAINFYPGRKIAHEVTSFLDWGTPERLRETGAEIL